MLCSFRLLVKLNLRSEGLCDRQKPRAEHKMSLSSPAAAHPHSSARITTKVLDALLP